MKCASASPTSSNDQHVYFDLLAAFTSENVQPLMYTILQCKDVLYKGTYSLLSPLISSFSYNLFHSCPKHGNVTSSGGLRAFILVYSKVIL